MEQENQKPEENNNRPVTERIKTFEDACRELGDNHPLVEAYRCGKSAGICNQTDVDAYLKLRIICAALNESGKRVLALDEAQWYPLFYLYTADEIKRVPEQRKAQIVSLDDYLTDSAGFVCALSLRAPSGAYSHLGSRLYLKSRALSNYCGTQFAKIWADFLFMRK